MYVFLIVAVCTAAVLSWYLIPRILIVAYKKKLFDLPDARKVHQGAVPQLGGISFLPSLFISLFIVVALRYRLDYRVADGLIPYIVPEFCCLAAGLVMLYLTGVRDDLIGLRYRAKFVAQFLAAALIPLSGLWINDFYGLFGLYAIPFWIGIPFTILLTVFITNAINLIDGIDGLASGLSIVALAVFGTLFYLKDLWIYSTLAFAMLGVLVPFFFYNVFGKVEKHQKIFMGDTGSLTLGLILAFLAIRYASINTEMLPFSDGAIVVAFSTLLVPMLDVLRVMFVRWQNGTGLFSPDRNHIHHKLIRMGFSFRQTMVAIIVFSCTIATANILLAPYIDNNVLFIADLMLWIGINSAINLVINRRKPPLPLSYKKVSI